MTCGEGNPNRTLLKRVFTTASFNSQAVVMSLRTETTELNLKQQALSFQVCLFLFP